MKFVDKLLQRWRFHAVRNFLPDKVRLIDVGTHEGEFFDYLGNKLGQGYGIDPLVTEERASSRVRLVKGYFPELGPETDDWDAVTLLAVLEHIPGKEYNSLRDGCLRKLRKGGLVVITVPQPKVDAVLAILRFLRLVDGMSLEQHHGFDPEQTTNIFRSGEFELVKQKRFQLGLNNIFVFRKL